MVDHVVSQDGEGGWRVTGTGTGRFSTHATQADAVAAAVDLCAGSGGGKVLVLGAGGRPRLTRPVPGRARNGVAEPGGRTVPRRRHPLAERGSGGAT